MFKKLALLSVAFIVLFSLNITADNHLNKDKMKAVKAEQATVEGTLVCAACDLKETEGANAACKVYGHRHALKTMDGKYINFLENKYSEDLIKGEKYHNKKMTVQGIHYANANLLEVESFEVGDKKMTWCNHCSAMDACMAKK